MAKRELRPYPDLKTWRDANGLSQREAAKYLGMSQIGYSRFERRVRFMRGQKAKGIVKKTGVPLEILVGAA
jgi:transcriptional regulator with XRE-family HTH domain